MLFLKNFVRVPLLGFELAWRGSFWVRCVTEEEISSAEYTRRKR